jgi:dihydroxy-acid dehydratase
VAPRPAIVLLRGSLAPEGALIKPGIRRTQGRAASAAPAVCFDTSDAAVAALRDKAIAPGSVLVHRGAGACGGPAMGGGASRVVFAIDGAGMGDHIAMLTDGHLSGLVCKGLVVAEVAPEAALGGPLALVHDGDTITIDLDTRRVDLEVSPQVLEQRRAGWQAPPKQFDRGWLQIYRRNVGPLAQGAVLTRENAK